MAPWSDSEECPKDYSFCGKLSDEHERYLAEKGWTEKWRNRALELETENRELRSELNSAWAELDGRSAL